MLYWYPQYNIWYPVQYLCDSSMWQIAKLVIRCLSNTLLTEAENTPNKCNYSGSMLLLASLAYFQPNVIRLSDDLSRNGRLFAGDTSLSCVVNSTTHLQNKIRKISNWAFERKMSSNPDPSKQAQEVVFSHKPQKISHASIYFNNNLIEQVSSQKDLA